MDMRRERTAWAVSTAAIALLALYLPGSLAQREDDYRFVRTLVDIHRQVTVNYVEPVDESKLREAAIAGMLTVLDPFTAYVPPAEEKAFNQALEGSFEGVGIQLNQLPDGKIEVVTPIDGSPAFKAGVQAGDVIVKVNGEDTAGKRLDEVITRIKGPSGSDVTLTVRRETAGKEAAAALIDLKMQRTEFVVPTIKGFDRNADNTWNFWVSGEPKVAYVRLTQFTGDTFPALEQVVRKLADEGMRGLILDVRFNPGGRLDQAIQVADLFLDQGTIVSTKGRNRPESVITASPSAGPSWTGPMAVIINGQSASASEVLAGALSDNRRAVVVGTRSYGKGSVQEVIKLDGNTGELKLTSAYYYLPSGRLVHRKKDSTEWGVEPNIPVPVDEAKLPDIWRARIDRENFRRPPGAPATVPATQPAQEVVDEQLRQALHTVTALVMFGERTPAAKSPR